MIDLAELDRAELENALEQLGARRFHGAQVFRWLYKRGVNDPAAMTDLSQALRTRLASETQITTPVLESKQVSSDGTMKFLFKLADGKLIESVYIPDTPAQTFCVSTQVGCAMKCAFCLTGTMGLVRNLTAGEIAGQVRVIAHETGLAGTPFNIVLMGMGEPLHNYDAVMKSIRMLADNNGLDVHSRRITLSTVGLVPQMEKLANEELMPSLAISLHATTDEQRDKLVPINKRFDLAKLIEACKNMPMRRRGSIMFEYVMLAGENDSPDDARRLVRILNGFKTKINLLPLNEAPGIPYKRPSDDVVNTFAKILADAGLTVTVRKSRGRDIRAACGQLAIDKKQ